MINISYLLVPAPLRYTFSPSFPNIALDVQQMAHSIFKGSHHYHPTLVIAFNPCLTHS